MPHFTFDLNEDGTVRQVLKDGQIYKAEIKLEQLFSVVTIYFKIAEFDLTQMAQQESSECRRRFGLQSFLMSLTALEAFTNTYFHLRAQELGDDAMLERVMQSHGSLSRKIADLVSMSPDGPLQDQDYLLNRIFDLSQLRNEFVHPRWTPSALTVQSVTIKGLVENSQALFEDRQLCREALLWCLLVIARVAQTRGSEDVSGFMFRWTGKYGCTLPNLLDELGLTSE